MVSKDDFSLQKREGLIIYDKDCTLKVECCELIKYYIKVFYILFLIYIDKKVHRPRCLIHLGKDSFEKKTGGGGMPSSSRLFPVGSFRNIPLIDLEK